MNNTNKYIVSHLVKPVPPWILRLSGEKIDHGQTERTLAEYGITARVLNGGRMRTTDELFSEFSSRLDFPDYFGRNWDALDETLADLSWLPGLAYAVMIEEAGQLLEEEPGSETEVLFRLVEYVAEEWATPVNLDEF
jgi:RNAse (barnase) inhibitor barstar